MDDPPMREIPVGLVITLSPLHFGKQNFLHMDAHMHFQTSSGRLSGPIIRINHIPVSLFYLFEEDAGQVHKIFVHHHEMLKAVLHALLVFFDL